VICKHTVACCCRSISCNISRGIFVANRSKRPHSGVEEERRVPEVCLSPTTPVHTFTENFCWCRCVRFHVGFHLLVHADYGNWLFISLKTCPIGDEIDENAWLPACMLRNHLRKVPLRKYQLAEVVVLVAARYRGAVCLGFAPLSSAKLPHVWIYALC